MPYWNRTENPQINPYIYGQLISDKGAKTVKWGKEWPFQQMVWQQWDGNMQKNGGAPQPQITSKKSSRKVSEKPKWNSQNYETLRRNIDVNPLGLRLRNSFSARILDP